MDSRQDVAVIGMSCRFPDADNVDEFWSNLITGRNSIKAPPKERWYMSGQGELLAGYLKCPLDEFDANFFNISPKEAPYIDPQHRLFLEVSWESLENAGIPPTSLNGSKTGVYLGIGSDEYFRTQLDASEDTMYKVVGNSISAATGRLSFFLNLLGPSIPIEATCASAAVAVHLACQGLQLGECSMALAGGVNVMIDTCSSYPTALVSPSCRSFDASASGFAPAEGCGVIVLKLLEDAQRDKNEILGVIRGSYLNHTGKSTSYGTPRTFSEERVIRDALRVARVDPRQVSYVEAHAGGTAIGDPIEVKAISNVFTVENRTSPLILGAFKTNIGHPMSAAGVAGIIKMLLCMKHHTIPQNLHLNELHPEINLAAIPAIVPSSNVRWESSAGPLIGAVNCFGITGTNVHLVIQEPPPKTSDDKQRFPSPPLSLLTISAKDEIALEKLREKYKEALDDKSRPLDLSDFAFSANTSRSHLSHRVALVGATCDEMSRKLGSLEYVAGSVQSLRQPIVFLFTGTGCQYFGMAKGLYDTNPIFRETFDKCNIVYRNNLGISLKEFIWEGVNGNELNLTKYSQPAIFVIEFCLFQLWTALGVRPDFVLGHSIGEFAACVAAGILSFEDGMKLVCCRSLLVDSLPEGQMIAIGAPLDKVTSLIESFHNENPGAWIDVACMNSIDQTVISTEIETGGMFKKFLSERAPAVKSKVLPSQHAFHSRSMDPILDEFERIANEVTVGERTCKYISGLLNRETEAGEINGFYWRNHCRNMVSFSKAIDGLLEKGCKVFLEVSPQPILLNFLMSNNSTGAELVTCPSLRVNQECWLTMLTSLAKIYVNTNSEINFQHLYKGKRVQVPTYTFNRKKCWAPPNANRGNGVGPTREKQFHSLLGWKLNLAMSKEIRFYNFLSNSSTGYVHDHVIVDNVIIPAACYVEMLLTLARKEFGIKYPVIENLQVLRACVLDEKMKQIQTKAEYEGGNLSVSIFSECEGEWIQHAQATLNLTSVPTNPPPQLSPDELSKLESGCPNMFNHDDMYHRMDSVGISMGPLFRSTGKLGSSVDKSTMLAKLKSVKSKEGEFIIHPITVDALVQTFWEYKMCRLEETPFALPVGINKFIWYGEDNSSLSEDIYFHIPDEDHGFVYTMEGRVLAEMEVLTVFHSTTSAFLRSIAAVETLPQFISKDWIPLQHLNKPERLDMKIIENLSDADIGEELQFMTNCRNEAEHLEEMYGKLTYCYILKALLDLAWSPVKGISFTTESLIRGNAPLVDSRAYAHFMKIMEEEGLVGSTGMENEWILLKDLPTSVQIQEMIADTELESEKKTFDFAYIQHLGASLSLILEGQMDPMDSLMSNPNVNLTQMYAESRRCLFDYHLLSNVFERIFKTWTPAPSGGKLRILEIGAGTGTGTSTILQTLERLQIPFEYIFTDIAPFFVHEGSQKFAGQKEMRFKTLDIQKDPKSQGFSPYTYDVVIANQVLHATEDLKGSLENTRHLLAPGGFFFLSELVGTYRDFAISFDLLKSFWENKDGRPYATVDGPTWCDLLSSTAFTDISNFTLPGCQRGLILGRATSENIPYRHLPATVSTSNPAWLIFGHEKSSLQNHLGENLRKVGRNVFYILEGQRFDKVNNSFTLSPKRASDFQQLSHVLKNYAIEGIIYLWGMTAEQGTLGMTSDLRKMEEVITGGFLNVLKLQINSSCNSKIFLITEGAEEVNPAQGTLWGMLDTFFNEYQEAQGMGIDIDGSTDEETTADFILNLLWDTPNERGIIFKNGTAEASRLHTFDSALPLDEIVIPKTGKYKLVDPTTFQFGSLQVAPDVMEVSIRAVGLNFRDLLLSTAILETEHPNSVGLEFGGVVTHVGNSGSAYQIGDRVAGLTCSGALASHIEIQNPELLFRIPPGMSFAGAATLPVAYGTCFLSMVDIGHLQPKERVLIHTGSGGVGLAGIQLARYLGAEIFVTAGTAKKRRYLRECLGLAHVYNSRTHDYKAEILRDTNGEGVDVVVNTLTGPGFKEVTLDCMSKNGRFIELSKLNVWSPEDVEKLRPDVEYTILDAFDMILNSHPSLTSALAQLTQLFATMELDVLPHTGYPLAQIKSAFKYFHAHNHIGKVIVDIPASREKFSSLTLYNSESTYMVTGGIGGLGFEVGNYLWENDGNVLLVGRSKASEEMETKIASYGERMRYVQCDIGDYEKCKELLDSVNPPLRGVFHCAGVFANGFIVGQSNENYAKSFQSKVYGTWNLHLLTRNKHLDHFVIFSSVAAVVGSTGLSNYSAANRYLDSLAHYRVNQCGLPALTLDWGPWAEVGTAAGYVAGMFKNFHHFPPQLGLQSMERAMRLCLHDIVIADMDMGIVTSSPRLGPYLSELSMAKTQGRRKGGDFGGMNRPSDILSANLAKEVLAAEGDARREKMEVLVETIFKTQSGLCDSDKVDKDQQLTLMGMDSLIGMEMRLRISKLLDVQIPATAVMEHNSIRLFSAYLTQLISPGGGGEAEKVTEEIPSATILGTPEEPKPMSHEDVKKTEKESHHHKSKRFPKFMAKQLQKFNNSEKKNVKCNGTSG